MSAAGAYQMRGTVRGRVLRSGGRRSLLRSTCQSNRRGVEMFRLRAYLGWCMASVLVVLGSERRVEGAGAGPTAAAIGREPSRRERAGLRGSRRVVLAAIATMVMLAWGAAASLAADYQDKNHNVCEGTFTAGGCLSWGSHVTGSDNVAFG